MSQEHDGTKTKTYGLVALAALMVALLAWWRSGAPDADEGRPAAADASTATPSDGPPVAVVVPRGSDVEPWRAPRAAVAGTVRDDRGQPIAGAQVCAVLQDDTFTQAERRPPQCATTGPNGRYRIDELLAADHHLHASARGHISARYRGPLSARSDRSSSRVPLRAGVTREGVDFVLAPGGVELLGVVKDIAGGEVEGAWVTCSTDEWSDRGSAFARSDAEGRFSLWVEPTELYVRAFAEGYTRGSRTVVAPGTLVELFLTPESVLVGTVVRAEGGEPVAGARVSIAAAGFADFFGQDTGSVITGDDGRFRLEGLEPGGYEIRAVSEELRGRAAERIHVGLGQTSEPVIVPMHAAFAIRGAVLVDDESPCPFASVVLQDRDDKDSSYGSGAGQEDGTVLVQGVRPGTYGVSVYCEGMVSEDAYPDVVVAESSIEGLRWSVHEGGVLRGVVLDANGEPVHGALVSARGKAKDDPRARRSAGRGERTTADGAFVIDGLLPGTYELSAYHRDFPAPHTPPEVVMPEGGTVEGVTLTMLASGEVHGIVRDEAGTPVAGASVGIKGPRWVRGLTNDEGRFVIRGVEAGEHRVVAERSSSAAPMRAPGASDDDEAGQRVQVRAGETTEVELVVESQGGRITGRVLDEDGEPVPDAFVDAVRESDSAASSASGNRLEASWSAWTRQPVLTDEDGRFELTGLADRGNYSILANRKGGGEAFAEHVRTGSLDVDLTIEATGLLAGVVRLEGGGAPEHFQINVTDLATGVWQTDRFSQTKGKWRVTNLPPGSYQLGVTAAEGNAKLEVELAQGAHKSDVELVLSPRVRLRGTLVDATTGEPVAGLKVTVAAAGGPVMLMMEGGVEADQKDVSDAQGRFEVDDAPTGSVYVIPMAPGLVKNDYGMSWISRRIPTTPREQDLGRIELVAARTGDGERAGNLGFKNKEHEVDTDPLAVRHVVAVVRPGGPADVAGLKVGDEIIAVDGQDVRGQEAYRYGTLIRVPAGTAVKLEVVDGEGQRTVTVTAGPPS